jgi:hypothetical protein
LITSIGQNTNVPKWRKHEKETMLSLGLQPTALSGAGWISKEDGENQKIIAQLKSTEGKSVSVKKIDIDDLVKHGRISRKVPVFVVCFYGSEPWVMARASQLGKAAKYLGKAKDSKATEKQNQPASAIRRSVRQALRGNDV